MLNKKYIFIILVSVIIVYCSCQSGNNIAKDDNITFNVNKNLLSENQYINNELSFSFYPPKGWEIASEEFFDKFSESIKKQKVTDISIVQVFYNPTLQAICYIDKIDIQDNEKINSFLEASKKTFEDAGIQTEIDSFRYSGFDIKQLMVINKQVVSIKLTFFSDEIFEIVYNVPKQFYEKNVKSIESSIGSINKLRERKEL